MLFLALPEFLTATLFLFAFAVVFSVVSAHRAGECRHDMGADAARAGVLPAIVLGLLLATYGVRLLRGTSLVGLKEAEFIRMARLKGLTPRRIPVGASSAQCRHTLAERHPLNVAILIGGVVVVEKVFGFPASARCWSTPCNCATCR